MMLRSVAALTLLALVAGSISEARADGKSKAARDLAGYLMRKFGAKAATEGGEALARRIATAATRHGDDVFRAVRRQSDRRPCPWPRRRENTLPAS